MDTLSKMEIEAALASRLPNCAISCTINPDSGLSIDIIGPHSHQFTIININRLQYHGEAGINRLVREILEEMVITRKSSNF
ncbi:hypothetical protein ACM1ZW_19525 [Pseudomonas sp. NFX71]|uniref:hypothetical protein n=1 Tax=Pseudomonas sp. NFX71 TaxID=3399121 RepID=UPI003A8831ED